MYCAFKETSLYKINLLFIYYLLLQQYVHLRKPLVHVEEAFSDGTMITQNINASHSSTVVAVATTTDSAPSLNASICASSGWDQHDIGVKGQRRNGTKRRMGRKRVAPKRNVCYYICELVKKKMYLLVIYSTKLFHCTTWYIIFYNK